jgi:formamidopyrimidine-DNA glycosylase
MPELPDITIYIEALETRILGQTLQRVRIVSPFLLRTFDPPIESAAGRKVVELRRLGKRIAIGLDGDLWLVLHLMIAGRLQWSDEPGAKIAGGKSGLAAFDFSTGTLSLTEAGSKKRASLHVVTGEHLHEHRPPGLEPLEITCEQFVERLRAQNRTLKRALTMPALFSGIGNAFSDEILHRARLSPVQLTSRLSDEQAARLYEATQSSLREWIDLLREQTGERFPTKVTAFRPEMAVHGKYGEPCPVCSTPVQRIRYADNETNYCPTCQTNGKLLADRSLSRLLKDDWPRRLEDWE